MAISRDHILQEIRRTAEANGGKPLGRLSFFTETGIKESDWRGRYWVRWNDVLRDAGFGPNALVEGRDNETLLDRLAELALELGHIPVNSEMRLKKRTDPTFPNEKTYARFGSKAQLLTRLRQYSSQHPNYEPVLPLIDALGLPLAAPVPSEESASDLEIGTVYLLRAGKYYKLGCQTPLDEESARSHSNSHKGPQWFTSFAPMTHRGLRRIGIVDLRIVAKMASGSNCRQRTFPRFGVGSSCEGARPSISLNPDASPAALTCRPLGAG